MLALPSPRLGRSARWAEKTLWVDPEGKVLEKTGVSIERGMAVKDLEGVQMDQMGYKMEKKGYKRGRLRGGV